jgi:hypothetical protein
VILTISIPRSFRSSLPKPVPLERGVASVGLVDVQFDREALELPIRIELIPLDEGIHRRPWHLRRHNEPDEALLESRPCEGNWRAIDGEGAAERPGPRMPPGALQELFSRPQVEEVPFLGPLEHAFERCRMSACRLIKQRARQSRERDAVSKFLVLGGEYGEVEAKGMTLASRRRNGHVDSPRPIPQQFPEPCGGGVARDGPLATGSTAAMHRPCQERPSRPTA